MTCHPLWHRWQQVGYAPPMPNAPIEAREAPGAVYRCKWCGEGKIIYTWASNGTGE